MNGHPASSATETGLEVSNRRVNVLAVVGVLAGALMVAIALGLDVSSTGGLWPARFADPSARPTPLDVQTEGQADALEVRPSSATSAATSPSTLGDPTPPAGPDGPDVVAPRGDPDVAPAAVDTTMQAVADAITAILQPVADLSTTSSTLELPPVDGLRDALPLGGL
jgi:hypothetical protein